MKKNLPLFLFITAILISACGGEEKSVCTPPPQGFSASDLIGTWMAGSPDQSDTLIFDKNGKYKQTIHLDYPEESGAPDVNFESEWLPWRLEFAKNGLPYLYLEDMNLCASYSDIIPCDQKGGGGYNPKAYNSGYWYDPCRETFALMEKEGILIVLGVPKRFDQPPRRIKLFLLLKEADEGGWTYFFQLGK